MMRVFYQACLLCWLVSTGTVAAHNLKLFVTAQGDKVQGRVYLPGGTIAQPVPITVQVNGETVATFNTDANGEFRYHAQEAVAHTFHANAGAGHLATFQLTAAAFAGVTAANAAPATMTSPPSTASTDCTPPAVAQQLTAIQAQLTALQQQLVDYEQKTRWHEILGGLGYILGLAGLWVWLQQRRGVG